jgi:wyosine [tRNA(Phe)-imidazoG37] synthetase (radical SAM superfamily)
MTQSDQPTSTHIFGPVPSRRLGLSLGIDLLPVKTCTYDCLYCQVGKTTRKETRTASFVPVQEVLKELEQKLLQVSPDFITLSGSGEPTLHSGIGQIISGVKKRTGARIAVLTNGSLLWRDRVRKGIFGADLIMPTLCSAFEETFRAIHKPARNLHLERIVEGMKRLRSGFKGEMSLEVMLLRGFNDTERELVALRRLIGEIRPDRIQLNTVVRPPADASAMPLDSARMEEIKTFFGSAAEVISPIASAGGGVSGPPADSAVLEMARRRPVRVPDVAHALNRPAAEAQAVLNALVANGSLKSGEHAGETYYYYRVET